MPKTKISEFSSTPANNTDIDSINIAEGCAPSGINDAIRELMAQLKDFQTGAVGDSFNGPVGSTTAATGAFTTLTTTGTINNLTVGRGAGAVSTNTAVGASALAANTTGFNNAGFGQLALTAVTTGDSNTALGRAAMNATTTGANNVAVGTIAMDSNTSGSSNTAVGSNALKSNTTASNNTAVGYRAAYSNTTAEGNIALGMQALYSNTTGIQNTALGGVNTMYSNSTGSYNTGIGYGALLSNTTASYNTAVGYQAGYANTTGTTLSAFGQTSLYSNTTGSANVAYGNASLYANTTGTNNTALGVSALQQNTTASNNTAVGHSAGYSNTTGATNTAVGVNALYTNSTGSDNTAVGRLALQTATGSGNTAVGENAGNGITTGAKNTLIGRYNGNQGGVDFRTQNNCIVISDGDGNPRIYTQGINGDVVVNATESGGNAAVQLARGGTSRWFIWNDNSTNYLNIVPASFTSGVSLTPSATSWSAYSDRRIKSNIVDLDYGLDTIMAIQPRRYTVTANGENSIGFIAQELKTVLPEAVVGEEIPFDDADTPQERSSKTMGVAKDHIIPVLVKAMQEQQAIIESLKARLDAANL